MNTIDTYGQATEVPMANGQLESSLLLDLLNMDDEQWQILRGKVNGRVAADIDESLQGNVNYLRAYIEGAMASINARLLMPSRLADAEVPILLDWAQFTAATVRRLRQLDEEMAMVDEPWAG